MHESVALTNSLANEDWQSLAHLLMTVDTGLNGAKNVKRLRKKVGLVRHILHGFMTSMDGSEHIDLSFLVGNIKTIENLEKDFDTHGIREREFLIFLKLLLFKFERQKLVAKKPMERRIELVKLKGAVERGNDLQ